MDNVIKIYLIFLCNLPNTIRNAAKMLIKSLLKFITGVLLILVLSICCESCQNGYGKFQEILQRSQQPGRFKPKYNMTLFQQTVYTKVECLDICLRTAECGSFDVRQRDLNNARKKSWICVINLKSQVLMPDDKAKGWIHFSLSSQDLQKVSYTYVTKQYITRERRKPLTIGLLSLTLQKLLHVNQTIFLASEVVSQSAYLVAISATTY